MASTGPILLSDGSVHLEPVPDADPRSWQVQRLGAEEPIGVVGLRLGGPGERAQIVIEVPAPADSLDQSTMAAAVKLACTWAFRQEQAPSVFWLGPTDTTVRAIIYQAGFRVHPLPQRDAWATKSGPADAWYADLRPSDLSAEPAISLTAREHHVLAHMARGRSNAEIAAQLGISENTVKNHVRAIMERLQAPSRTAAVVVALQTGLASLEHSPTHSL